MTMGAQTPRNIPQWIGQPFIIGVLRFLPFALTLAVLACVVVFLHDLVGPPSAFGKILASIGLKVVACEVIAYHIAIIPTAPIPMGGALLCVPGEQVKPAGFSFGGVASLFMSMGASAPEYLGSRRPGEEPDPNGKHSPPRASMSSKEVP